MFRVCLAGRFREGIANSFHFDVNTQLEVTITYWIWPILAQMEAFLSRKLKRNKSSNIKFKKKQTNKKRPL